MWIGQRLEMCSLQSRSRGARSTPGLEIDVGRGSNVEPGLQSRPSATNQSMEHSACNRLTRSGTPGSQAG